MAFFFICPCGIEYLDLVAFSVQTNIWCNGITHRSEKLYL
jgi:hypothetical protein